MRIVLQDGPKTFELGRIVDGNGIGGRFRDAASADQFLRRFRDDPGAMMKLRQLAGEAVCRHDHHGRLPVAGYLALSQLATAAGFARETVGGRGRPRRS